MKKSINTLVRLILFLALGMGIFYFVYKEQSEQYMKYCLELGNADQDCSLVDKVINDLKNAKVVWLVLTLVFYFISNISRAIRWKLLVEAENDPVRVSNTFLATMVGYFANLAIPRFGEFVRAGILSKYEKMDSARIMGTVVTDRLLDVFCLLLMFGLGMILASAQILDYLKNNARFPNVSYELITGLILGMLLIMGLMVYLGIRYSEHKIMINIKGKVKSFMAGLLSIRSVKNHKWLIFHSVVIWLMYYLMTYVPFLSFDATSSLGPVAGLLVFIFGGLGMVLPAPGGIGTYHAMIIAGLSIYGISGPDAFSFAMIIFLLINICVNLVMGVISLIILPLVNKNYHPRNGTES